MKAGKIVRFCRLFRDGRNIFDSAWMTLEALIEVGR